MDERRLAEVSDGAKGGGGGANFGVSERGVVSEEVVDRDYVVDFFTFSLLRREAFRRSLLLHLPAVKVAHRMGIVRDGGGSGV